MEDSEVAKYIDIVMKLGLKESDAESFHFVLTTLFSPRTDLDTTQQLQESFATTELARAKLARLRVTYRRHKKQAEAAKDYSWHSAGKVHGTRSADRNMDEDYNAALLKFNNAEGLTRTFEDIWSILQGRHFSLKETSANLREEMEQGI